MPAYQSYPPSLWAPPAPPPDSTIIATVPSTAQVGSAAFTMNVTGTNFTAETVISFDGDVRPTTFIDATHVSAQVASPTGVARSVAVTASTGGTAQFAITVAEEPEPEVAQEAPEGPED